VSVFPEIIAVVAAALATTGISTSLISQWVRRIFKRDEEVERTRLRAEVLGPNDLASDAFTKALAILLSKNRANASEEENAEDSKGGTSAGKGEKSEKELLREEIIAEAIAASENGPAKDRHAKFALLLVDYYAYGLTQARTSFAVSLTCSLLGGLVLIAGVALAIFTATTDGHVYAGVVTSVAGVLTTSIGALFHQQANRALKHMEEQTNKLRQDMKAEQDATVAIELLEKVSDEELKGRLQAALILRFSGAKLPETGKAKVATLVDSGHNGVRRAAKRVASPQDTLAN
jgi:hypothetical protein